MPDVAATTAQTEPSSTAAQTMPPSAWLSPMALASLQCQVAEVHAPMPAIAATTSQTVPSSEPLSSCTPDASDPREAAQSHAHASWQQGEAAEVDAPRPAIAATTYQTVPPLEPLSPCTPDPSDPMAAAQSQAHASWQQGKAAEVDAPTPAIAATTYQTVPPLEPLSPCTPDPMAAAESQALASSQQVRDQKTT